jgi:hypothetical protein
VPDNAAWTIFAPDNKAFKDDDLQEYTGLSAEQLMRPENKKAFTQVGFAGATEDASSTGHNRWLL